MTNENQTVPTSAEDSQTPTASASTDATTSSGTTTPPTRTDEIDYELEALRAELFEGGPLPDANYYDDDPFLFDYPDS